MKKILILTLLILLSSFAFGYDASNYNVSDSSYTFPIAREYCQNISAGWDMVKINNVEENQFVFNLTSSTDLQWIGANDSVEEGNFRWVHDGTTINSTYNNFNTGEPSGDGDYAGMYKAGAIGKWNDATGSFRVICEKFEVTSFDEYFVQNLLSRWYLNDSNPDTNETNGVDDSWGLNDGQLFGKEFNPGTITGAERNNNLTGTITGATWNTSCELPSGATGNCLEFDGDGDYVTVLDSEALNISQDLTISMWVKSNLFNATYAVLGKDQFFLSTPTNAYGIMTSGNSYYFGVGNGTDNLQVNPSTTVNEGEWAFIAMTFNYSEGKLTGYVNSASASQTKSNFGSIQKLAEDLWIGKYNTVSSARPPFNGTISDVQILDKALNSTEVLNLYNSGVANYSGYAHEINFPLDEGAGTEVYTADGKFGGYYEFDGDGDYIETSHLTTLSSTSEFTICAYVNNKDLSSRNIFSHALSSSDRIALSYSVDGFTGGWYNGSFNTMKYIYSGTNTYVFICTQNDGGTPKTYLNGVLGSGSRNPNTASNANTVIGALNTKSANFFNGSIDEVRIWNRSLSQAEIQGEMNANAVQNPEGIVAYYDFNEREGTTAYDNNQLSTGARQATSALADPVFSWDKAFNFDGVNDYVDVGSINSNSKTISLWFKKYPSDWSNDALISTDDGTRIQVKNNGQIVINDFSSDDSGDLASATGLFELDKWNHLVMIINSSTKNLSGFLNGNFYGSSLYTGTARNLTNLEIGRYYTGINYFNGSIGEVRIYNRSLTESEIQTLYSGLKTINIVTLDKTTQSEAIDYWNINSIYGNPYTTTNNLTLNVPYGNISFDFQNSLGYYNNTYALNIQPGEDTYYINVTNNVLNVSAINGITGNNINDFNVTVLRTDNSYEEFQDTTSGEVLFNLTSGTYNIILEKDGHLFENQTVVLTSGQTNINLTSLKTEIFIRRQANGDLITKDVNLTISQGVLPQVTYMVENGTINISLTNYTGLTELKFTTPGYDPVTYSLDLTPTPELYLRNLTAYMSNNSNTEAVVVTVQDLRGKLIEGARVEVQGRSGGVFIPIEVGLTDVTGVINLRLVEGETYLFIITKETYTNKSFQIEISSNIILNGLAITLEDDEQLDLDNLNQGISYDWQPKGNELFPKNYQFNWTVGTDGSSLSDFYMIVNISGVLTQNTSTSSNGGTLSLQVNLTDEINETFYADYCFQKTGFQTVCYRKTYIVHDDYTGARNLYEMRQYIQANMGIGSRIVLWIMTTIVFAIAISILPFLRGLIAIVPTAAFAIFFGWVLLPFNYLAIIGLFMFIAGFFVMSKMEGGI